MKDTSGELPGKAGLFATLGTMYAHTLPVSRGPQSLTWRQVPDPTPGPGEVLLQVTAVAVNRMDLAGVRSVCAARWCCSLPGY